MSEQRLEIDSGGEIEIPSTICCNCARPDGIASVASELKLTRYFAMAGTEYTFTWDLPYCSDCASTASRTPVNRLHIALMIGVSTAVLFLGATIGQMALETNLLGGYDFWIALGLAAMGVSGFYASRRPAGAQTSYYQPIRIRKLRQKFISGEVTGIVLGFTNALYLRRFRDANAVLGVSPQPSARG